MLILSQVPTAKSPQIYYTNNSNPSEKYANFLNPVYFDYPVMEELVRCGFLAGDTSVLTLDP